MLAPWKGSYDKCRQHVKKQRHYFANKGPSSQSYGPSCSRGGMWELNHKENWVLRNWCCWTVVLGEASWESLGLQGDKPVNPKRNQPWVFIGRTNAEPEAPILWPPDVKSYIVGKDPDAGKDWKWEKGMTEDVMFGWHHQLDVRKFEQAPGVGDGQNILACCSPWGCKELTMTKRVNWLNWTQATMDSHLFQLHWKWHDSKKL